MGASVAAVVNLFLIVMFAITQGDSFSLAGRYIVFTHTIDYNYFWLTLSLWVILLTYSFPLYPGSLSDQSDSITLRDSNLLVWVFSASGLIIYAAICFKGTWLSDDVMILGWVHSLQIFHPGNWTAIFRESGFIRPIPLLWWKLDTLVWGNQPFFYYVEAVIVHALNATLVYRLARTMEFEPGVSKMSGSLFFVLPGAVYAVGWLSSRYDLLLTTFSLIYLIGFLRWIRTSRWEWSLLSLAALIGALLSKENAVLLPLLSLGLIPLVNFSDKPPISIWLKRTLSPIILVFIYLCGRWVFYRSIGGYIVKGESIHTNLRFIHPLRLCQHLAHHIFYPLNFPTVMNFALMNRLLLVMAGIGFLVVMTILVWRSFGKYLMFWPLVILPLLPVFSIVSNTAGLKSGRFHYLGAVFLSMYCAAKLRFMGRYAPLILFTLVLFGLNAYAFLQAYPFADEVRKEIRERIDSTTVGGTYEIVNISGIYNDIYVYHNRLVASYNEDGKYLMRTTNDSVGGIVTVNLKTLPIVASQPRGVVAYELDRLVTLTPRR